MLHQKKHIVMGVHAAPPRITYRAVRMAALWIGLPLIGLLFGIDFLLWMV